MGAQIIDGKSIGQGILQDVSRGVLDLIEKGIRPHLAVVIAGEDPASHVYVRNKERACETCGILSTKIELPDSTNIEEILRVVDALNRDSEVHGILVQSPVPKGIDEVAIASSILPSKDVDGFHPHNLGRLVQGDLGGLLPCTPSGVIRILEDCGTEMGGKRALVLGRSRIVGVPMALMLAQKGVDATVTIAHSRSEGVEDICKESDIIVAAMGVPHIVKGSWVKPGAFVVDVGISRLEEGGLAGDVSPEVSEIAGWMTPVPGGVGPMTIAMLMSNTLKSAKEINN